MSTAIIRVLLIIIPVSGIRGYMRCLVSGCCGSSEERSPKRIKVKDKDLSHYPRQCTIKMDGMSCGDCTVRVENTLDAMEDVWARMGLEVRKTQVYMKQKHGDRALKDAVKAAEYTIFKINHTK